MKFKVDEDLPVDVAALLRAAGHDASTVREEALTRTPDELLWVRALPDGKHQSMKGLSVGEGLRPSARSAHTTGGPPNLTRQCGRGSKH